MKVPARYPGGGAKQMIETLTGKQVPSGKLSTDIGIQVFNVGTSYALARAIHHGEPLISRLVTVTGHVGRDRLQAQAVADGLGQIGLVLDDQHAHAFSMVRAGRYRRRIEIVIRPHNATRP